VADRSFGISTRLFRDAPLSRDHLVHIAAHGFDAVELYDKAPHFEHGSPDAIAQLAEWLSDTRLSLHSVHVSGDAISGNTAPQPLLDALAIANRIPFKFLVMHRPSANTERTLQAVTEAAAAAKVRVALEVKGDPGTKPDDLVQLIEDELEDIDVGVCLDFGRAHLLGDLGDAIETVSGHLWTTHVHDNGGRKNDHLVPYAGTIPWDEAMMEMQKIGYDGAFIFELAPAADPVEVLKKAAKARERLEKTFVTF
jgi:sugar phosphate isomerase/epimerase